MSNKSSDIEDNRCKAPGENSNNTSPSRRNLLLAGTTFAAVSALASAAPVRTVQAEPKQQPAPATDGQPNIVFIMGDDIGILNIGADHRDMMAGRTPNLDQI